MDRELLLEIGCEELPASWLPTLTNQVGDVLAAQLSERRLAPETPVETYSTPRRLAVRIGRIPERQSDFEELVTGPPASAPAAAIAGFAAKQGIDPSALEKIETPKGLYLAFRKRLRGRTAVDVLPEVLGGTLRGLSFPKLMHWDAMLEDGKGELLFGRPIRWILYTYGGRVVPFTIARTPLAQTSQVQEINTGAATYGHRFLTTSGRAGRSIKVRSFDEYRARLLENFVILERSERHDKIASALDAKAQRLQGRVSRAIRHDSGLLAEVPDLVEYPSVIAGTFAREFLELPDEVLTTTLIHHQHYFPVEGEDGKLKEAFLAVINIEPDNERTIARNAERVVTARLRDATFFWEADRKTTLESKVERLSTLVFHKKAGSYKDKSARVARLAEDIARVNFGAKDAAAFAERAGALAKADLTTDMVREFPELQGVMGGVYAREGGELEEIWKAIYFQYLPVSVEATASPTRLQLGKAAISWAAVSLADKLDTLMSLFAAGERPTGSRDPFGLRRAAQGALRILVDLPELTGVTARPTLAELVMRLNEDAKSAEWAVQLFEFMRERLAHIFEQRGFDPRSVRAVTAGRADQLRPLDCRRKLEALPAFSRTDDFQKLATAFKRVRNIARELPVDEFLNMPGPGDADLRLPAEQALLKAVNELEPAIVSALEGGKYDRAFAEAAQCGPAVDTFFADVLVMDKDPAIRKSRLWLMRRLESVILRLADISEIAAEEKQA